jgi:Mrp family chromosome partitioning ATPase
MQASAASTPRAKVPKRGRRLAAIDSTDLQRQRLLAEIQTDMGKVCPDYRGFSQSIRHFVSRHLSSGTSTHIILGVVSADAGVGRTTVAIGIANALADIYERVSLVEMANASRGEALAAELGLDVEGGLVDHLDGTLSFEKILVRTQRDNLWLLPATGKGGKQLTLDTTARVRTLLSGLRDQFDVSVVDLPPLLESEEAPALVEQLDGVVVVVGAGKTEAEAVAEVVELCGNIPIRGVILNRSRRSIPKWLASLVIG